MRRLFFTTLESSKIIGDLFQQKFIREGNLLRVGDKKWGKCVQIIPIELSHGAKKNNLERAQSEGRIIVIVERFEMWCGCSVTKSGLTLCNPMDYIVHQAPPWDFPGKNIGLPLHSPGILPNPGTQPISYVILHRLSHLKTPRRSYYQVVIENKS